MKVKFKNGEEFNCSNPTEQKLFKDKEPVGWICAFSILGTFTSETADELLTEKNISEMNFVSDENKELFTISNYNKTSSVVVRHNQEDGVLELQISKGV